jgi:hypothetical protein
MIKHSRTQKQQSGKPYPLLTGFLILIVTASVKWSGGGDIRDDKITNWDLESLKKVAMIFPDAVAACK